MEPVQIKTLQARYHLIKGDSRQRQRLDQLLRQYLDRDLADALLATGVSDQEEVVIREIFVPVNLPLGHADGELSQVWREAFGNVIKEVLLRNDPELVARFHSRLHAVCEFARDIKLADRRRAWVWRKMGFIPSVPAAVAMSSETVLLDLLAREQAFILPVLRFLLGNKLLGRSFSSQLAAEWAIVIVSLVIKSGIERGIYATQFDTPSDEIVPVIAVPDYLRPTPAMDEMLVLLRQQHALLQTDQTVYISWLLLGLMLAEPNIVHRSEVELVQALRWLDQVLKSPIAPVESTGAEEGMFTAEHHINALAGHEMRQDDLATGQYFTDTTGTVSDVATESSQVIAEHNTEINETASQQDNRLPRGDASTPATQQRLSLHSDFGGLAFLINILHRLDLYREIARHALFQSHPSAWVLQHIALTLLPAIESDDPILLVFCGWELPLQDDAAELAPPTELEQAQIKRWCKQIGEILDGNSSAGGLRGVGLIEKLCRKRAHLVLEPGWAEVYFSLDEMDVDIRRAGMDLDPGYVAALGSVIRFIYE